MSKCFITKYPVAIDNDNLPRINTMRIKFQRVDNPTSANRSFRFKYPYGTNVTFRYIGNGHFTDSTLTQNLGKEVTKTWDYAPDNIYMSNDEGEVEFDISKITTLQVGNRDNVQPDFSAATNLTCDLNHLKGRIQVEKINMPLAYNNVRLDLSSIKDLVKMSYLVISSSTQVTGDIANLANMTAMNALQLYDTQVTGDISSLKSMTAMNALSLNGTQVTGDISSLKSMTAMNALQLYDTQVTGDISSLKSMTQLTSLSLSTTGVTGDISSLKSMTQLTRLSLSATGVTGDISNIVNNLTNLKHLGIPPKVIITDEQKKTLTDRGCTVVIK